MTPKNFIHLGAMLKWQPETITAAEDLPVGVVQTDSHNLGVIHAEPIIVMLDALLRYAKAYQKRYGMPLRNDGVLSRYWKTAALNVRALLNGDGAVAMERNRTTDSKDNGACERMFWHAMSAAGFTDLDLD